MFVYARRLLLSRRALWGPSAVLAFITAVPGTLAATVLAPALVGLLLTGNFLLAASLLPDPFSSAEGGPSVLFWVALAGAALVATALWCRLFALAVWLSDQRNDSGIRAAWSQTSRSWRPVFALYIGANTIVVAVAGVLVLLAVLGGGGAGGFATVALIVATGVVISVRTVVRIFLTVAVRSAVLDGRKGLDAWHHGREIMRDRRREAAAAWMALAAIGVTVWMGGRFVSPVLQDTAYEYPHDASYTWLRELGHLLLAVPLEAFLIGLSLGVWTSVWLGQEVSESASEPAPSGRRESWLPKALAGVAGLAVIANGIPTLIDNAWRNREDSRLAVIERREITPSDVVRSAGGDTSAPRTVYGVDAVLDGETLSWTTTIDYLNDTNEVLEDVGLHVYPAAYTRPIPQIPLAPELLASDISGLFRSGARRGTLSAPIVEVDGDEVETALDETALLVELPEELPPGRRTTIEVELEGRLPAFPERFGIWDDVVLLGNWIPIVAVRENAEWRLDEFDTIGDPFFSTTADYDVEITTEATRRVVGSGTLAAVTQAGPRRQSWTFEGENLRDAAFAVGPFLRGLEDDAGPTIVRSWYPAEERSRGAANFEAAVSAIRHYENRFGPLPFDEVELVETHGFLGGMEYPGLVFVSSGTEFLTGIPLLSDLVSHSGFEHAQARYVIGHEMAHQWWYAAVGNDQVREPWLDEALAEISARLWLLSIEETQDTWRMSHGIASASPAAGVIDATLDDFSTNTEYVERVYVGGSALLDALRLRVGDDTFNAILRAWYEEQKVGIGTIDEFVETVSETAGAEAASFLEGFR